MTEDQAIMAAMRSERAGSSQNAPVARMPAPPAMTAAVERVSPSMCRKTVRMLTSLEEFQRSAAMAPFIRTPAAATAIMMRGWTATGAYDAMDGGEGDPCGEEDERERIDEGGEHARALVAEGLLVGGGAALEVDGDEGEPNGQHVREVVAGLGDEGEGVRAQAEVERRRDVAQSGGERDEENALHPARVGRDHVHKVVYLAASRDSSI